MRFAGIAVAVCLLLSGCGAGSEPATRPTPDAVATTATTKATTPTPTSTPSVLTPTGVSALPDLKDFQCSAGADGVWNSTGILENTSKRTVTYQVTVFVGEANGQRSKAQTKQYVVSPEGSAKIGLTKLPAPKGVAQCYVQVLAK